MFAALAVLAFAIAFILHVAHVGKYVTDAEILGWLCIAVHLIWPYRPWRTGQQPVPPA
jgi:hypothetical protein